MTIEAIYQHYEGTDAQCAAIQIERELAWATDITPSGALRYLDCSGNIHYINGEGGDQFWEEGTIRDEFGSPTFIPAVQYKGIGGDLDAPIVIGAQGRLGYDSFDGVYGLRLQADTGSLKLRSTGDEVNISGRYVNQSASQGINILASGVYDGSQKISLMAYGGSATYRSSNDTNIQADSGDVNIYAGIASAVNISGRSGVNIIGLNSSDVTYDAGTHTMLADCGAISITASAGPVNISGTNYPGLVDYSASSTYVGWVDDSYHKVHYCRHGNIVNVWFTLNALSDDTVASFTVPYQNKMGYTVYAKAARSTSNTGYEPETYIALSNDDDVVTLWINLNNNAWPTTGNKFITGSFTYYTE